MNERRDPDRPNESAPGQEVPDPSEAEAAVEPEDPDAPNESAPGHNPDPEEGD
jgi:hypothetical protein